MIILNRLAVAGVLAAMLAGSTAFADDMMKTGAIKSVDAAKHELVLDTGDAFTLGDKIDATKLKAGAKVSVKYEMKDGKMVATEVGDAK